MDEVTQILNQVRANIKKLDDLCAAIESHHGLSIKAQAAALAVDLYDAGGAFTQLASIAVDIREGER